MKRPARRTAMIVGLTTLLALMASCGESGETETPSSTSSSTSSTSTAPEPLGAPIKFLMITFLRSGPANNEISVQAAQAAASAINDQGGVNGRPVVVDVCDDGYNANGAADCGRRARDEGYVAVVAAQTAFGDSYLPLLATEPEIPSVGNLLGSSLDMVSPVSFPISQTLTYAAATPLVADAAGAETLHYIVSDNLAPNFSNSNIGESFFGDLYSDIDLQFTDPPVTAVTTGDNDGSDDALQALESEADAYSFIVDPLIMRQSLETWAAQGLNLTEDLRVVVPNEMLTQDEVDANPELYEGVYILSSSWPANWTENENVQKFHNDLAAAGVEDTNNYGAFQAWATVHVTADLIEYAALDGPDDDANYTSTALLEEMRNHDYIAFEPFAPFDWGHRIFDVDEYRDMAYLNMYSEFYMISRVIDGEVTPVVEEFQSVFEPAELDE